MRTLSGNLANLQKANNVVPLVKIALTYGAFSYTYLKSRVLDINHHEEAFNQKAIITLDNRDGALTDLNFEAYTATISYGVKDTYSATAPLKVIHQDFPSTSGKRTCELTCYGVLDLMAESRASADYAPDDTNTDTVKTIVNAIAGATLACFSGETAYTITWDSEDSLVDVYMPKSSLRIYEGNARLAVIRRLLDFTKCVIRSEDDGLHCFVPTTTGTAYDYQYSLVASDHKFTSKILRNQLVIPNKIIIHSEPEDSPAWPTPLYSGSATDATSFGKLPITQSEPTYLASNAQATAIAEALQAKYQMFAQTGSAFVPMNVGQEVYDYVKVTDSRADDSRTGNIGALTRHWNAEKNEWTMTFSFGGWLSLRKTFNDLETYPGGGAAGSSALSSPNKIPAAYIENLTADNISVTGGIFLTATHTLDDISNGATYSRVLSTAISAGLIKLDELVEGTTYQRTKSTAISPNGLVIIDQLVDSSDVNPPASGTYGLVKLTQMTAGVLKLNALMKDLATGNWYDKSGVSIDASHGINIYGTDMALATFALPATGGVAIQSFANIDGSHVTVNSTGHGMVAGDRVNISGTTNYNGNYAITYINANSYSITATWVATETGTGTEIQCYVGSDGVFTAGAGAIKLDSTGLKVYDSAVPPKNIVTLGVLGLIIDTPSGASWTSGITFKLAGANPVYMGTGGSQLLVTMDATISNFMIRSGNLGLTISQKFGLLEAEISETLYWYDAAGTYSHTFAPETTLKGNLGSSSKVWASGYFNSLYSPSLTSGRVVIAGGSGLLQDDADLTFSDDTLTATYIDITQSLYVGGHIGTGNLTAILLLGANVGILNYEILNNSTRNLTGVMGYGEFNGTPNAGTYVYALYGTAYQNTNNNTTSWYYGAWVRAYSAGTGNATRLTGVYADSYSGSSGGTIANIYGFHLGIWGATVAGGTVTNAYGLRIDGLSTSGTVTNAYGIYINSISGAGTLNIGISLQGATHIFELPSDATDPTGGGGAATGRIPVLIGGATRYLAYY